MTRDEIVACSEGAARRDAAGAGRAPLNDKQKARFAEVTTTALADTSNSGTFIEEKGHGWKPIKSAPHDGTIIDVWLTIHASPRSMGMGDSFGVPDAWFQDGKWVHTYRGKPKELERSYITHWRPKQQEPA